MSSAPEHSALRLPIKLRKPGRTHSINFLNLLIPFRQKFRISKVRDGSSTFPGAEAEPIPKKLTFQTSQKYEFIA